MWARAPIVLHSNPVQPLGVASFHFVSPIALISSRLASPLFGHSALRWWSCSLPSISFTIHMHGSWSGSHMLGCFVGSLVLLWEGSFCNLSFVSCRSSYNTLKSLIQWESKRCLIHPAKSYQKCTLYLFLRLYSIHFHHEKNDISALQLRLAHANNTEHVGHKALQTCHVAKHAQF